MAGSKIVVRRSSDGSIAPISLRTGQAHLVELPSGVTQVHLSGPAFALDKCFLLPTATEGIRALRTIFGENTGGEVLVVGHTDASASVQHNEALSLGRAKAIAAFISDDVDLWLEFFTDDPPGGDPWGTPELIHMLGVLPEGGEPYFSAERGSSDAIRRFQEAMGMDPNGHADEDVLREVVSQYLALDGTSLPPETTVVAHGCGEAHPLGGPTDEDRRVDIFIFHPTIDPAPASEVSADEYPQWVEAATAFHEIGVDHDASDHLELRLHDADSDPMPQAPFRVRIGKAPPITGISDDDGFVFLKMPPQCPESIHVEWGDHPHFDYEYSLDVFPACSPADPTSRAITRLNNLGYAPLVDLEAAVRQFQADYRVDHEPLQGLEDGALPPATQARLDEIWDRQTNASRA